MSKDTNQIKKWLADNGVIDELVCGKNNKGESVYFKLHSVLKLFNEPQQNEIERLTEENENNLKDLRERYDLLREAYNFIHRGANTFTNIERIELEEKLTSIFNK
jgi:hypothetical protein